MPNQQTPPSTGGQAPIVAPEESKAPIYTMPAKYIPPRKIQKQRPWLPWVIVAVLVLVLMIVGVVAIAAYLSGQQQQQGTQNGNVNVNVQNINQNTNVNSNQNKNSNSGVTLNLNVNAQLNTNIQNDLFNSNANTANVNTATNTNAGVLPGMSDVKDARDKDRDGLTDVEEELYGTKFQLPDSDKDGYVDGTEIRGAFSPVEQDETILQSGLAIEYNSTTYGWTMLYPKKWIAAPLAQNPAEVVFTSDTQQGEFVEVIVTENTQKQSAADWYVSQYPDVDPKDLRAITIGNLQGIVGEDGLVYYLANAQYIFTIVYQFGTKTEVHYATTFEMMAKSFVFTPVAQSSTNQNINTNVNTNTTAP